MRVLIIEDEVLNAMILEDCVLDSFSGAVIDVASCESDAIELGRRACPDLILADFRLKSGDGVAAVKAISAEAGRPMPVVYLTGSSREVLELVPDAVVVEKPYTCHDMLRAVELVAGGRPA